MPIYDQEGDGIRGEIIVFTCRKYNIYKKPIQGSSKHRATGGKLNNAYCVINKRFRQIPNRTFIKGK